MNSIRDDGDLEMLVILELKTFKQRNKLRQRIGAVPRIPFRTTDAETQIVAVRQGLGITTLPCFVGDADPLLVRVPGTDLHMYGTVWLLTQGETRKTKRVRFFTEFVSRRLAVYAPLLAGLSISRD
jgi:DNA-binding transcriptional LysR family regulator